MAEYTYRIVLKGPRVRAEGVEVAYGRMAINDQVLDMDPELVVTIDRSDLLVISHHPLPPVKGAG